LRPKSETADLASTAPRQLIIEWITQLWPSRSRARPAGEAASPSWAARRQPARSPLRHGEEAQHLSRRPAHPPRTRASAPAACRITRCLG